MGATKLEVKHRLHASVTEKNKRIGDWRLPPPNRESRFPGYFASTGEDHHSSKALSGVPQNSEQSLEGPTYTEGGRREKECAQVGAWEKAMVLFLFSYQARQK